MVNDPLLSPDQDNVLQAQNKIRGTRSWSEDMWHVKAEVGEGLGAEVF